MKADRHGRSGDELGVARGTMVLVLMGAGFRRLRSRAPRSRFVALLAFSALIATGVLNSREALGVFSNSGPITAACMFVLSAGLERTGVMGRLGGVAVKAATRSPWLALVGMGAVVLLAAAFINNTPVVVVLTPWPSSWPERFRLRPGLFGHCLRGWRKRSGWL